MKKNDSSESIPKLALFTGCTLIIGIVASMILRLPVFNTASVPLTPWASIGGCGASGSGSGSDGIKWIGQGVSEGLVKVEVLPKYNFGKNFSFVTIAPKFSIRPVWNWQIEVQVPFSSKTAAVQYKSNQPENTRITGGVGDLSLYVARTFGMEGEFSGGLTVTAPTGQYDIKRGPEQAFMPKNLQMGGGLWAAAISLNYSRDVHNGMIIIDGSYYYPFAVRLSGQNEFLDTYYKAYITESDNKRFYYRFKPYGENDLGDYTPPGVSGGVTYAYRKVHGYVHSFAATAAIPLGVAWIHSEQSNSYNPMPDPDHKAWNLTLSYGIEFSRDKFPIFCAVALPIHDRSPGDTKGDPEPMRQWNGADTKSLFQEWVVAVGFKGGLF
jgi:hypothetical protein